MHHGTTPPTEERVHPQDSRDRRDPQSGPERTAPGDAGRPSSNDHRAGLPRDHPERLLHASASALQRPVSRRDPPESGERDLDHDPTRRVRRPQDLAGLGRPAASRVRVAGGDAQDRWTSTAGGAVSFSDPRSGSVGESRARVAFARTGLPAPLTQVYVYDQWGRFVGITDFVYHPARIGTLVRDAFDRSTRTGPVRGSYALEPR